MIKPLEYYYTDGSHVIFNKYTIENGVIRNKKEESIKYHQCGKYSRCVVFDDSGRQRLVVVGRAIASTVYGPPPTLLHTADHIDRNPENDTDENIRWLCKSGQRDNQDRSETKKTSFLVVNDGVEKTVSEWVVHLKGKKNSYGNDYTNVMITKYAQKKHFGFSYKEYPDLPGEVWKEMSWSKNTKGVWKISDMNRVKYVTKFAENVLSGERLGLMSGYPKIYINGQSWYCHILSFMTFSPEEYANKKPGEMVLHEEDNRLDFSPHKLRLGTHSENMMDAHNNGRHDDKKTMRNACMSYVNGVFEKEHESLAVAEIYLRSLGYEKASYNKIGMVLRNKRKNAYDRTWVRVIT